ncbi:MAG: hypothetical protein R3F59_27295 [Myxococcota bacterium]
MGDGVAAVGPLPGTWMPALVTLPATRDAAAVTTLGVRASGW